MDRDYSISNGKSFIDRTEIHITVIYTKLSDNNMKIINPICNDNKRVFNEIGIEKVITCKKCLKWINKRIK